MPKTCTVFKDIGKLCADLLSKDYKVGETTVEVKSKTPVGITFTPTAKKSGEKVSGTLKAEYTPVPGMASTITFGTTGAVDMSLEASKLFPGLVLTCETTKPAPDAKAKTFLTKANLVADYKAELFACKSSYDYYKKDLLASCSMAYQSLTFGLDGVYSTKKSALAKYAAACQFVAPEFTLGAKCDASDKGKTLSCSYFHKVSGDMQLGVSISKPLFSDKVPIEFGTVYKMDKDTTVKAKVDSEGILCTSYKQKISPLTTMTLAAQVDTVNMSDNKHKFGMALSITP